MSEEYPRRQRITQRSEFGSISKKGRRVRALDMDVRYLASPLKFLRVGIIVPRYGHSAVERNLLKRRLRELARRELLPAMEGLDIVIRCQPSAYERSFGELKQRIEEVRRALLKVGKRQDI